MSAPPTLSPVQNAPTNILPETGTFGVARNVSVYPLGIYVDPSSALYDPNFISGAVDQVRYVYREIGGDVLDIELDEQQVYHSYEKAVTTYGYIINVHQAENSLGSALGAPTGTFDQDGQMIELTLSGSDLSGSQYALRWPRWDFTVARKVATRFSAESGIGGDATYFSASIPMTPGRQFYDLQEIVEAQAASGGVNFANILGTSKIAVKRVYYKSPHSMWRFFGYYGGLNAVGNLSTYGMFADDSTFEVIPPWQNKLQAMAYEDAIWTRNSHYSYDIRNNQLRIYPVPQVGTPDNLWIEFIIPTDTWSEDPDNSDTVDNQAGSIYGVNNMNTLPFSNLPYKNINSMGKYWIREYSLAICKGILSYIRGKITSGIPFPNETIQLNHAELSQDAKDEMRRLREELMERLDRMLYKNLAKDEADMVENTARTIEHAPLGIYVG